MSNSRSGEAQPFRVSVTGIDGSGKDTISEGVLARAAQEFPGAVKLGRPAYRAQNGEISQIYPHTTSGLDRLYEAAGKRGNPLLTAAACALDTVAQSRIMERQVLSGNKKPDVLASSRDPLVDPLVYFDFFAPDCIARAVSPKRQVQALRGLTGIERHLIIMLDVEPDAAVERIQARNENQGKPNDPHENTADLSRLAASYGTAIETLQTVQPTPVAEILTTGRSPEEVIDMAYFTIRQAMSGKFAADDRLEYV